MTTVIYDAQKDGRNAPISFDGVLLRPGSNDLEDAAIVRLLEHPDMGAYIKAGVIQIDIEPKQDDPAPPRVNVNKATLSDLVALPQIGQTTGRRLIKGRPFGSLDDVQAASGLSDAAWAIVAPWLEV